MFALAEHPVELAIGAAQCRFELVPACAELSCGGDPGLGRAQDPLDRIGAEAAGAGRQLQLQAERARQLVEAGLEATEAVFILFGVGVDPANGVDPLAQLRQLGDETKEAGGICRSREAALVRHGADVASCVGERALRTFEPGFCRSKAPQLLALHPRDHRDDGARQPATQPRPLPARWRRVRPARARRTKRPYRRSGCGWLADGRAGPGGTPVAPRRRQPGLPRPLPGVETMRAQPPRSRTQARRRQP